MDYHAQIRLISGFFILHGMLCSSFFAPNAGAAEPRWVESALHSCLGPDESPTNLENRLLQQLRRQASEQATEIWVESQTWLLNRRIQQDRIHIFSRAHILREQDLKQDWHFVEQSKFPCLKLSGRFLIDANTAPPVSAPQIQLRMSQKQLEAGQSLWLNFKVSQDSYITLYNVSQQGAVSRLLPNGLQPEPFLARAGQSYRFPDTALQQHAVQLKPRLLPGQKQAQEYLLLLATREPLWGLDEDVPEALFELPAQSPGLYRKLQERLLQLPAGAWNDAWLSYQIGGSSSAP